MLKLPRTYRAFVAEPRLTSFIGHNEPHTTPIDDSLDEITVQQTIERLTPIKKIIVKGLLEGYNLNQIAEKNKIKQSHIYVLKEELKQDLAHLKEQSNWKVAENNIEPEFMEIVKGKLQTMPLSDFIRLFIADYDNTNEINWVIPAIQNKVFDIWESNPDTEVRFENRDLKIITVISYLIRKLMLRTKPLVIDYYLDDRDYLLKMIKRFKKIIRISPIIHDCLLPVSCDDDFGIKLKDGSAIRTFHSRGRKPTNRGNIIIFDSILNKENQEIKKESDNFIRILP